MKFKIIGTVVVAVILISLYLVMASISSSNEEAPEGVPVEAVQAQ